MTRQRRLSVHMRKLIRYCIVLCAIAIGTTQTTALLFATIHFERGPSVQQFRALFGERAISDSAKGIPESVATDLARRILRIERLKNRLASDEGFLRSADD